MSEGSSPLTRGKLHATPQADDVPGLIPAHAGKTRPSSAPCWWGRAHPRSRGENGGVIVYPDGYVGSSPLTRGKHSARRGAHARTRLIPAHAGKTGAGTPAAS